MPQTQDYNAELVENLATAFPRRKDASYAWGNVLSYYLNLQNLRAFWPLTSRSTLSTINYDVSGQGRNLTMVGAATPSIYGGLQNYLLFAAGDYLGRATEAGLDVSLGMTMGCWINWTSVASQQQAMGKRAGAGQRSYYLINQTGPAVIRATITNDGTTAVSATTTGAVAINTWYFISMRFLASTKVSVQLNTEIVNNLVGIPASIFVSIAPFQVSGFNGVNEIHLGGIALPFLCAASLSDTALLALYWLTRPLFFGT